MTRVLSPFEVPIQIQLVDQELRTERYRCFTGGLARGHYGFLSSRHRRDLVPLCKQLLAAVVPTTSTGTPTPAESTPMWICPLCGGPMVVIERLTAGKITLRSPPQAKTA
jgi:hypothetical protein